MCSLEARHYSERNAVSLSGLQNAQRLSRQSFSSGPNSNGLLGLSQRELLQLERSGPLLPAGGCTHDLPAAHRS